MQTSGIDASFFAHWAFSDAVGCKRPNPLTLSEVKHTAPCVPTQSLAIMTTLNYLIATDSFGLAMEFLRRYYKSLGRAYCPLEVGVANAVDDLHGPPTWVNAYGDVRFDEIKPFFFGENVVHLLCMAGEEWVDHLIYALPCTNYKYWHIAEFFSRIFVKHKDKPTNQAVVDPKVFQVLMRTRKFLKINFERHIEDDQRLLYLLDLCITEYVTTEQSQDYDPQDDLGYCILCLAKDADWTPYLRAVFLSYSSSFFCTETNPRVLALGRLFGKTEVSTLIGVRNPMFSENTFRNGGLRVPPATSSKCLGSNIDACVMGLYADEKDYNSFRLALTAIMPGLSALTALSLICEGWANGDMMRKELASCNIFILERDAEVDDVFSLLFDAIQLRKEYGAEAPRLLLLYHKTDEMKATVDLAMRRLKDPHDHSVRLPITSRTGALCFMMGFRYKMKRTDNVSLLLLFRRSMTEPPAHLLYRWKKRTLPRSVALKKWQRDLRHPAFGFIGG